MMRTQMGAEMRFAVIVFAVFAGCAFAEPNAYPQQVGDVSTAWAANWNAKYLDAVMKLYAPEPVFLPAIGPRWTGAAAIRKNFAGLLAIYNPHLVLHPVKIEFSGDLAYDSGAYEETVMPVKGGAPIRAKGNYLFLFKRAANGNWKILEQTWTSLKPVKL